MRIAPIVGGAGVVLAAACAYHPTPIPLSGDPWTIHALAGEWTGTWFGTQSGRSGTITFSMRAAGDSAFGDVLMAQPGGPPLVVAGDDPSRHRLHAQGPKFLAIKFVSVSVGEVRGQLEPYVSPDCDCVMRTTFTGRLRGDTVRGAFETRAPEIATQTGVWVIVRHRNQ